MDAWRIPKSSSFPTRQTRAQRLFGQVYVEAFLTILMIEKTFGTQLQEYAVRISKDNYALRQEARRSGLQGASERARTQRLHF